MLKIIIYIILLGIAVALVSGGVHLYRVSKRNASEMAQYEGKEITPKQLSGKTLVIYYSLSGHTQDIAERIQKMTGADMYRIQTVEKLNRWPWFYLMLKKQLDNGVYPKLKEPLPDISKYETIFVGGPVWWYTVSTPMRAFLQQMNFQGKKVVPFTTQGSNYGTYFDYFNRAVRNADLQPSASFNNLPEKYNQAVDNKIATWINSLQ